MSESSLPDIVDVRTFKEELAKARAQAGGDEKRPRWWLALLSTSGGTALVTVLLGGIIGTIITGLVQSWQKDRDFQSAWMKTRGEQALAAYNEYLLKEQETVTNAFRLIGDTMAATDDLINVTTPDFDPKVNKGIEQQKYDLVDNFNKIDAKWRAERDTVGLLISYYHHGQKEVTQAWYNAQDAVDAYIDCADERYRKSLSEKKYWSKEDACVEETKNLRGSLVDLNDNIDKGRRFVWEGWDSLACQKGLLDKKTCASILQSR